MRVARRAGGDEPANRFTTLRSRLASDGVDLLDLSDANPTHHGLTDPAVFDVAAEHVRSAVGYAPDARGPFPARAALAASRGGSPDDYWLTVSTSQAYAWLLTVLADPGQAVAVSAPGYPLVEPIARLAGVRTVSYPLFYVHPYGWEVDLDALGRLLADDGVRALVVVSPGNPTGAYLEPATADAIAELCAATGTPIIADEVFAPFALDRPRPAPSLGGRADVPVVVLDGLSKLLCAPQLKLGWLRVSGPGTQPLRAALDEVADTYLSASPVVANALPDLLDLAEGSVARVRERLATNLAIAHEVLGAPCRVRRVAGGWTVLVDVPRTRDDDALAEHLLVVAHLAVHPGWFYDLADPGSLALSLLPAPAVFAAGCRRLGAAVAG